RHISDQPRHGGAPLHLRAAPVGSAEPVNAFRQAKDSVAARMRELVSTHVELGLLGPDVVSTLRVDPYPYGVQANLHVLETLAAYSCEQGLTPRVVQLDELFAPSTLDL